MTALPTQTVGREAGCMGGGQATTNPSPTNNGEATDDRELLVRADNRAGTRKGAHQNG